MARKKMASRGSWRQRARISTAVDLTIIAQIRPLGAGLSVTTRAKRVNPAPRAPGARIKVVDYDVSADRLYLPRTSGYLTGRSWDDPTPISHRTSCTDRPRFTSRTSRDDARARPVRKRAGRRAQLRLPGTPSCISRHTLPSQCLLLAGGSQPVFGTSGLRGKPVYTCLSHDVVAHDDPRPARRLGPAISFPSSPDQAGFHEGFADPWPAVRARSDRRSAAAAAVPLPAQTRDLIG